VLLSVPGVGLLTATAMVAATSGDVTHFVGARHFASWFGLTPKVHSSGSARRRWLALLGFGCASALEPQQGALRAGQQAGVHLRCVLARWGALRRTASAREETQPHGVCLAGLVFSNNEFVALHRLLLS